MFWRKVRLLYLSDHSAALSKEVKTIKKQHRMMNLYSISIFAVESFTTVIMQGWLCYILPFRLQSKCTNKATETQPTDFVWRSLTIKWSQLLVHSKCLSVFTSKYRCATLQLESSNSEAPQCPLSFKVKISFIVLDSKITQANSSVICPACFLPHLYV